MTYDGRFNHEPKPIPGNSVFCECGYGITKGVPWHNEPYAPDGLAKAVATKISGRARVSAATASQEDIDAAERLLGRPPVVVEPMTERELSDALLRYENDELPREDAIRLFAYLVGSGMAWKLQGHYGRAARDLIESGVIDSEGNVITLDPEGL